MLKPIIEFHYWGLSIYTIMMVTGVLFAFFTFSKKRAEINCTPVMKICIHRSFVVGSIAALICANAVNWFLNPEIFQYSLAQKIMQGGFSFYYGMFGFFAVSALSLRLHKINYTFWINQAIPSVLLLHAFWRIGCSLTGCCYGVEVYLFGFSFHFPSRELEALMMFVLYFVFERKIKERRFFWYLTCYSILRFSLEFGRGDNRGELLSWLSPAQVVSIIIWVVLITWSLWKFIINVPGLKPPPLGGEL